MKLPPFAVCCLLFATALVAHAQSGSPANTDLSQYKTADELWKYIQTSPGKPSSREEAVAQMQIHAEAAAELEKRYPTDPRHWTAKLMNIQFDAAAQRYAGQQPDPAKMASGLNAIAAAPDAPQMVKAVARYILIQAHAAQNPDSLELETEIASFIQDFPNDPRVATLQEMRLTALQKSDPAKASALLEQLLRDPNPKIAKMAQAQEQIRDLQKKPLDLKFTAEDGSQVDLATLRGKVVLIDFWATWCGPCMGEVPKVVAAYDDLHPKGFEIVGISFDSDKSKLESVTKEKGMTWQQYFDGKGWDNEIGTRFGIHSIPTMWLVDKNGMVADTDGRDGLKEKVEKMLAQ